MQNRLLILLCLTLAGCGAHVAGQATTVKPGPITAILLIEKPSRAVGTGSQNDFVDGVVHALQACQIRVATLRIDELSLENGGNDEGSAAAAIANEHPDAVLSFVPARSFVARDLSSTRFQTRLIEMHSKKIVWSGQAVVTSGLALGPANSQVGADLVHAMAASGVLQSCPS